MTHTCTDRIDYSNYVETDRQLIESNQVKKDDINKEASLEELKKEARHIAKKLAESSREIARMPLDKVETTNLALIHIMLALDETLLVLANGM